MATVVKDFKIKSGLVVEGANATVGGYDVLKKDNVADENYLIGLIGGSAETANVPSSVVLRDANGDFAAGTITADLVGNVTGQVSDISNHSTSDLSEGSNKYFTNQRALNATSAAYDAAGSAASALADAETYADGAASAAQSAAISAAATDATTKANAAESNANTYTDGKISTEVTDRNSAIATAKSQAISTAASDATTKADAAQAAAELYTDSSISNLNLSGTYDALGAANTAESNANSYTDGKISTEVSDRNSAIATAKSEAITAAEGYTDTAVANLVDGAPALLNTLNELAAAIADNPSYATDVANLVSTKADTTYVDDQDSYFNGLAQGYATDAQNAAASDATTKANAALADAESYTDSAISTEVTNRNSAIATAKSQAISAAASDATTKANAALADANTYTDGEITTALGTAQGYATTAENNAKSYADSLAVNYDAAGSASAAESNANGYTDSAINALSTSDIEEGTNLYFTDERAQDAVASAIAAGTHSNIVITYDDVANKISFAAENGVADSTTDDLVEGSSNLYFTDARAVSALEAVVPNFTEIDINAIATQIAAASSGDATQQVVAYSFAKADYRTAKFLVKVAYGSHSEVSEVLLTLDSSDNIAITEYAVVGTNGGAAAVSADVSGGNVRLLVTPVNNGSVIKVMGTLLV